MSIANELYKSGLISKDEKQKMKSEKPLYKKLGKEKWKEFDKFLDEKQA